MKIDMEKYERFYNQFEQEEQEILVVFGNTRGGAGKAGGDLWTASVGFLAYLDMETNVVRKGDGRIVWPITDKVLKKKSSSYPYYFKQGIVYRLRVRAFKDRNVTEGRNPSYYNCFLVVKVLKKRVRCDELTAIFAEYLKPVVLHDHGMGDFTLNKNLSVFEGEVEWMGRQISVYLDVEKDNEDSWAAALEHLRTLHQQQQERDDRFRRFAADELTDLANDWLGDEEETEITNEVFARRIMLMELSVDADGNYSAYHDDDNMFYGHSVTVTGNVKSGENDVNIEG